MRLNIFRSFICILSLCGASSAAVIIDDFSTAQSAQAANSGSINDGIFSISSLGGARNISLTVDTENQPNESSVAVSNGNLDFSNAIGMSSTMTVIWDGGTDNTLSANGFTPVDLSDGGANSYIRLSTSGDFALNSILTLWSGDGNLATWNFVLPSSVGLTNVDLIFGAQSSTIGTFDITAVTAAQLVVTGITNADRSIDFIAADTTSEVPEPASLALVGLGTLALGCITRRRR
jgi:hypothetical protein